MGSICMHSGTRSRCYVRVSVRAIASTCRNIAAINRSRCTTSVMRSRQKDLRVELMTEDKANGGGVTCFLFLFLLVYIFDIYII